MILAEASPALGISITLLIIVHVVVSLLMILVVMMQRPKQEGLGAAFGGGMTDQLLGAGTTSFLQKATVMLGILFFVISLVLAILIGKSNVAQRLDGEDVVPAEATAAPLIPSDVALEEDDELLKALETATSGTEAPTEEAEAPVEEPATQEEAAPAAEEPTASEEEAPAEESVTPELEVPTEESVTEAAESLVEELVTPVVEAVTEEVEAIQEP